MDIERYTSFEEAVAAVTVPEQEYTIVFHALDIGEEVALHQHPNLHEWIIISIGDLTVQVGQERLRLRLTRQPTVIHLPPNIDHGLEAHSTLLYHVIRGSLEETI